MPDCKACGKWFATTNPHEELCCKCENAISRLHGYVARVVRCKDCRKFKSYECPMYFANGHEDFCSYGERKEVADA